MKSRPRVGLAAKAYKLIERLTGRLKRVNLMPNIFSIFVNQSCHIFPQEFCDRCIHIYLASLLRLKKVSPV